MTSMVTCWKKGRANESCHISWNCFSSPSAKCAKSGNALNDAEQRKVVPGEADCSIDVLTLI